VILGFSNRRLVALVMSLCKNSLQIAGVGQDRQDSTYGEMLSLKLAEKTLQVGRHFSLLQDFWLLTQSVIMLDQTNQKLNQDRR
jgi:hypothetical protein